MSASGAVYDDIQAMDGMQQLQIVSQYQAKSLAGRSMNVNMANYKSVQQNCKQRRRSMLKEQIFANDQFSPG